MYIGALVIYLRALSFVLKLLDYFDVVVVGSSLDLDSIHYHRFEDDVTSILFSSDREDPLPSSLHRFLSLIYSSLLFLF